MEEIQSNCLELGVTSGIKREEPTPDPNPEPRLKSEAKSEKVRKISSKVNFLIFLLYFLFLQSEPHPKEYDLRGDETFLKAPGFAMICDDLYMTPHGKKFGKLVLCGYPPIRFKSKMNVEILPEFQVS